MPDSRLILGLMRVRDAEGAAELIAAARSCGIDRVDTADIYGAGGSERILGEVLAADPQLRARLHIQTKFGIIPGSPATYRQDGDYLLASVDGSLERMGIDAIDTLLIHRPDPLADPFSTARAALRLIDRGVVRRIGVSNMDEHQIARWSRLLPISVNQIELSLAHHAFVDVEVDVNRERPPAFPPGLLPYCAANDVEVQAWSPLAGGSFPAAVSERLEILTSHYGASSAAVALAWLLRHPARVAPVIGTTRPERVRDLAAATTIRMTREHWYELYAAARGEPLP